MSSRTASIRASTNCRPAGGHGQADEPLEGPGQRPSQVTQVIGQDPALASKLLKVDDSAYYGFAGGISTIDRAVALLGLNMVKYLALSIGVIQALPQDRHNGRISLQGLWLHSVAVAAVCKELADRLEPGVEHDHLFVVDLLHDVGKILLLHFFPEEFQRALALTNQTDGPPLYLSERETIGLDHGQAGAMLLNRWKFPGRWWPPSWAIICMPRRRPKSSATWL